MATRVNNVDLFQAKKTRQSRNLDSLVLVSWLLFTLQAFSVSSISSKEVVVVVVVVGVVEDFDVLSILMR